MSVNVIPSLLKPGFIENMTYWHRRLGTQPVVRLIASNAKVLEDATNNARLEEWFGRTQDKFQTLMTSGIGSFLIDNDIDLVMKRWFGLLGRNNFCSIFGKHTIIARVVKKKRLDNLMELYNKDGDGKSDDEKSNDLYKLLSSNNWKAAGDYFPLK